MKASLSTEDKRLKKCIQTGVFLHEPARLLNKRCAWRLTTGSAFIKMARLKAIMIAIILLVGRGECARDLTKCVVCKKTLTLSQKRSRPALTYHELLSNFISRLDLDNSARICSACRIALTSSKSKQSAGTFVDVSKHFQFSLFWNGKGTQILKKKQQIWASGFEGAQKPAFSSAVN